jgi:hypothetical protein
MGNDKGITLLCLQLLSAPYNCRYKAAATSKWWLSLSSVSSHTTHRIRKKMAMRYDLQNILWLSSLPSNPRKTPLWGPCPLQCICEATFSIHIMFLSCLEAASMLHFKKLTHMTTQSETTCGLTCTVWLESSRLRPMPWRPMCLFGVEGLGHGRPYVQGLTPGGPCGLRVLAPEAHKGL